MRQGQHRLFVLHHRSALLLLDRRGQTLAAVRVQHLALAVPAAGAPQGAADHAVHPPPDLPVRPVGL
jgi:hypothetical protein